VRSAGSNSIARLVLGMTDIIPNRRPLSKVI
jgi:hypothetical protein